MIQILFIVLFLKIILIKYNVLLPIAGKAQRFLDKGYTVPKPLILAKTKQIIDWAMESIDYENCNLIFAVRLEHIHNYSIDEILKKIFGDNVKIGVRHVTGPGSILNSGSKIPDSTTI